MINKQNTTKFYTTKMLIYGNYFPKNLTTEKLEEITFDKHVFLW